MGFYSRHILPRIIDLAMRNKEATRLRAEWIPQARGKVLEVGIGSGLNLPFYTAQVERVYGVDPSLELQHMARAKVGAGQTEVEFLSQSAEKLMPLQSGVIDTVVVTWTLCSIGDALQALEEMKRVLSADGRLIFVEHGRAPDPVVVAWQNRLTPLWKHVTGGCHLNRDIPGLIASAGFHILDVKTSYLPGPRPMSYTYRGIAVREPLSASE